MIKIASLERKDGKIIVKISAMKFDDPACKKRIKLNTVRVISFLKENKIIGLGKCIKRDEINNFRGKDSGTWIFEEIPKVKKADSIKRKTKKVKKVLDKFPESVIIREEEKNLPLKEK